MPGDRSPGPAVPALPGETGATCPHVARGCRATSGHKAAAPLAALALFQPHPSGPVSCLQPPGLSPVSKGPPPTTVRARGSHLGAISWGAGPLGTLAWAPEGAPEHPGRPFIPSTLTRPLGADGVPDHEGHHVPQVITGLGEAPAVPLCAETFSPVIAVDDLLQPGRWETEFRGGVSAHRGQEAVLAELGSCSEKQHSERHPEGGARSRRASRKRSTPSWGPDPHPAHEAGVCRGPLAW